MTEGLFYVKRAQRRESLDEFVARSPTSRLFMRLALAILITLLFYALIRVVILSYFEETLNPALPEYVYAGWLFVIMAPFTAGIMAFSIGYKSDLAAKCPSGDGMRSQTRNSAILGFLLAVFSIEFGLSLWLMIDAGDWMLSYGTYVNIDTGDTFVNLVIYTTIFAIFGIVGSICGIVACHVQYHHYEDACQTFTTRPHDTVITVEEFGEKYKCARSDVPEFDHLCAKLTPQE